MRQEHQANHEHGEHDGREEYGTRQKPLRPGRGAGHKHHWHPGHGEPGADGVWEFEGDRKSVV